ncbi:hypothetical protein HWV62_37679 [Athelia sp. TMB]|nr:hypothetical protein HWV62_37679 [Athelia sp. TMB]
MLANQSSMAYLESYYTDPTRSPFKNRFGINYVPTPEEQPRILRIIAVQEAEAARLSAQIRQLEEHLTPLRRERDALYASARAHKGLLAPRRRIPYELWVEIFIHTLPPGPGAFASIDAAQPPLLLGRVCSEWRDIALSTTRLWNSISFAKNGHRMTRAHVDAIFAFWVAKAGSLPLHIKLVGLQSATREHAVARLLPLTTRIHTLHTSLSHDLQGRLLGSPLPQLTTLTLIAAADPKPTVVSATAVNLRSLTMLYLVEMRLTVLPWHALTELVVKDYVAYNECFSVFAQCSQLTRLSLRYIRGCHDGEQRAHVTMPHLISFALSTNADPDPLLQALTLPALADVVLDVADREWPREQLLALLARSEAPLRALIVPNYTLKAPELLKLVERIPSLLRLDYSGIVGELPRDVARVLASRHQNEPESTRRLP